MQGSGKMNMPDFIAAHANVECPICGGTGWVCEVHPDRPWETGDIRDCRCGAPGMPCRCTGVK
jgi:hypothetical protein